MRIYGIDFTSRPGKGKPIVCIECELKGDVLYAGELFEWHSFKEFEAALQRPGSWIAGIDFPFGQSRKFIENIGWPRTWSGYVDYVSNLTREQFRSELEAYKKDRPYGDKEHRRKTDVVAKSFSPQKLGRPPVALMFYEGSRRLRAAKVTIPHMQQGDPERIVVESYPGVMARRYIGRASYKQDTKNKQTEKLLAREKLLREISKGKLHNAFKVKAPQSLTHDPGGDHLDALLCGIQAAWAWTQRDNGFGLPEAFDPLEGWIADPGLDGDK